MADTIFDPELMQVFTRIEEKTEREIFAALILAMMAYMPKFPASEFFSLCVSGIDDDVWMPSDTPPETRKFARSVMEGVMSQMLPQDPQEYLRTYPPDFDRDV